MFRNNRQKKKGFFARIFRSLIAVVILTALVFGLSMSSRKLALLDENKFAALTEPILSRLGLSPKVTGEVAGEFVERIAETGVNKADEAELFVGDVESVSGEILSNEDSTVRARFSVMADSGDENDNLTSALAKSKALNVDHVFYLGDLTAWGDVDSLAQARKVLDASGLNWTVIPGDHDLAQSQGLYGNGGLENFNKVFGQNYALVRSKGVTVVVLDNSANNTPLDAERLNWALGNIPIADFVMVSQPIYHPAPTDLMSVMGLVKGELVPGLSEQADQLLTAIQDSNTKAVFAGDHHMSSVNTDPQDPSLKHYVVGALAKDRNVQAVPRFYYVEVYEDGNYKVDEIKL